MTDQARVAIVGALVGAATAAYPARVRRRRDIALIDTGGVPSPVDA